MEPGAVDLGSGNFDFFGIFGHIKLFKRKLRDNLFKRYGKIGMHILTVLYFTF